MPGRRPLTPDGLTEIALDAAAGNFAIGLPEQQVTKQQVTEQQVGQQVVARPALAAPGGRS